MFLGEQSGECLVGNTATFELVPSTCEGLVSSCPRLASPQLARRPLLQGSCMTALTVHIK